MQAKRLNTSILVGGLEPWNFMTFHSVGNFHPSQVTKSIIFQRGRAQPPTRLWSISDHDSMIFNVYPQCSLWIDPYYPHELYLPLESSGFRLTSILAGHRVKTSRLGIIQWFSIALACRRFPCFFFRQKKSEFFEDWNDWISKLLCDTCRNARQPGEPKMSPRALGWNPWHSCGARSRKSADGMMFGGSIKSFRSVLAARGGTSFKLWGWMGVCYVLFSPSKCGGLRIAKCVLSRSRRPLMP